LNGLAAKVRQMTIAAYREPKLSRTVTDQGTDGRFHCFSQETVEAAFFSDISGFLRDRRHN
jgi:hypothetical protein